MSSVFNRTLGHWHHKTHLTAFSYICFWNPQCDFMTRWRAKELQAQSGHIYPYCTKSAQIKPNFNVRGIYMYKCADTPKEHAPQPYMYKSKATARWIKTCTRTSSCKQMCLRFVLHVTGMKIWVYMLINVTGHTCKFCTRQFLNTYSRTLTYAGQTKSTLVSPVDFWTDWGLVMWNIGLVKSMIL